MTFGQTPDTAVISFEGSRSMVWVMEILKASPWASRSASLALPDRDPPAPGQEFRRSGALAAGWRPLLIPRPNTTLIVAALFRGDFT
jgi:hypothetical protein